MEFRRFVSYVYAYRENEKQRNCGFVRVEIRQNTVRFYLHMSLPDKRGVEYKVYGFVRNGDKPEGVFLGVGRVKGGNVDVRMQMNAERLGMEDEDEGQPVSIEDLAGMIIVSSDFCRYGTVWDDGNLSISEFQERRKKPVMQEEEREEQIESEDVSPSELELEQEPEEETAPPNAEAAPMPESAQELTKMPESEPELESTGEQTDETLDTEGVQNQSNSPHWWIQLQDICSIVKPFGDDAQGTYLRIEPKELKYLPPQLWYLGRNSFLLHGYYNYRYLILGEMENGFVLGVPGVYFPMEEGIAAMFGFGRFVSVPGQENRGGRFGFWCRKLL